MNLISVLDTVELPSEADAELALAAGAAPIEPLTRRGWITPAVCTTFGRGCCV